MLTASEYHYWDVGEKQVITMAKEPMARIMRAIIQCDAKIHDTFSLEKDLNSTHLRYPYRHCAVTLRISLPDNMKNEFEQISGFKLTAPPKIHANSR